MPINVIRGTGRTALIKGTEANDTILGFGVSMVTEDDITTFTEDPLKKYAEQIYGNLGDDLIYGGAGNDTLYGGSGNDELYGGSGNDTINGETGDDYIEGGAGNDTINGGTDNDFLNGGLGNDILIGSTGDDGLFGDAGNDTLNGDAGRDFLDGGTGNDTLNGGADRDLLWGDVGNDTLNGGDGDDEMLGGLGNDKLNGGNGNDTMLAGGFDLFDNMVGAGPEEFFANAGNNTMNGDAGDDFMLGGDGKDILNGGTGDDLLYGQDGVDTLNGDAGDDQMLGGNGNDKLYGGDGDDELAGGTGNNYLDGGKGIDTALIGYNDLFTPAALQGIIPMVNNDVEDSNLINDLSFAWQNGKLIVTGPDSVDTLFNIEQIQIDGVEKTYDINGVIARDDAAIVTEDDLSLTASDLLGNDVSLKNGAPLHIVTDDTGVVGTTIGEDDGGVDIYLNEDGSLRFADGGYDYLAQGDIIETGFYYTVDNGTGLTDTAFVELTVEGMNDAPVVADIYWGDRPLNDDFAAYPDFMWWGAAIDTNNVEDYNRDSYAYIDRSGDYIAGDDDVAILGFDGNVPDPYGTGWGPTLYSINFSASAGETVHVTYDLMPNGDDALGVGYLLDGNSNEVVQTIFDLHAYDSNSNSNNNGNSDSLNGTVDMAIQESGNYRLQFRVGSYDSSGAQWVGAELALGIAGITSEHDFSGQSVITFADSELLANATDVDQGDVLTISDVDHWSTYGATVTIFGDDVIYDPTGVTYLQEYLPNGDPIYDSFEFTVSDGNGGLTTAHANIQLLGNYDIT